MRKSTWGLGLSIVKEGGSGKGIFLVRLCMGIVAPTSIHPSKVAVYCNRQLLDYKGF
jgi:ABC-type antimicrobial peptide transport system ATPase subunit